MNAIIEVTITTIAADTAVIVDAEEDTTIINPKRIFGRYDDVTNPQRHQ